MNSVRPIFDFESTGRISVFFPKGGNMRLKI